jgi:hypothetical protein
MEIHHPPVVKNVALWTMRGALVRGKWTARMVGESVDRVGLKEFWDAEEIEGLYGVEKVAETEEEKVVEKEEDEEPEVQMRILGAYPVEAYPVDRWVRTWSELCLSHQCAEILCCSSTIGKSPLLCDMVSVFISFS